MNCGIYSFSKKNISSKNSNINSTGEDFLNFYTQNSKGGVKEDIEVAGSIL